MKEFVKELTFGVWILILAVSLLVGLNQNKKRDLERYQAVVNAFEQVEQGFQEQQKQIEEQNKLIEQYKRDCENITLKVINGEW